MTLSRHRLSHALVTAGTAVAGRLPPGVVQRLAPFVGTAAFLVARRQRRNIEANLATALARPERDPEVRRAALRAFRLNTLNWVDTLRLESVTLEELERRIDVDGWDKFEDAASRGRGVILIALHLGNIDLVGQLVAARGYPMTAPMEEIGNAALFSRLQSLRQSLGIHTVPASSSARPMLRALRRGGVVGLPCDRNLSGGGVAITFFGKCARVSKGPAWLARESGAAVILGYGTRTVKDRFQGVVVGPLSIVRTENAEADLKVNAQTIMAAAEDAIRAHPDQWMMFEPFWPSESLRAEESKSRHHSGPAGRLGRETQPDTRASLADGC